MGGCLSGIAGRTNGDNDTNFRNLNDSRHVMLLLAKKERRRDRALRRSISLGSSAHSRGQRDATTTTTITTRPEKKTAASTTATKNIVQIPTAERSRSDHTAATVTTTSNNNSQRSVASLQRSDSSSNNGRSRRSLTRMTAQPSLRRNLIETQKELSKLDSYGEYIPPASQSSLPMMAGGECNEAEAQQSQAKAA